MKKCIWCKETEEETTFNTIAHTVPQSLGGKNTCENVCDPCNHYFGNYQEKIPPVENVIKETFNISRARLLSATNDIGKNKALARFKSNYFKVNFDKGEIKPKASYTGKRDFQIILARQLKKGLYKMFLEEQERQEKEGHNQKFNFIRYFARYDTGDYPLFYFKRKYSILPVVTEWVKYPPFIINAEYKMKYLMNNQYFFEFEFLSHVFSIPISTSWEEHWEDYMRETLPLKKDYFSSLIIVEQFHDIDFTLSVLNKSYG